MIQVSAKENVPSICKLPFWFRQDLPNIDKINEMKYLFKRNRLNTVCESARCPNNGKCWEQGTATFMILGDICTRGCRFCAVETGMPMMVDAQEPRKVALAVKKLGLRYAVITSVTRDDLYDGGAGHFAQTIYEIRRSIPYIKVEILIPDFLAEERSLKKVVAVKPDVIGHNMETVERLFPKIRPEANYQRSLQVLRKLKQMDSQIFIKSGFMVGLGETDEEITSLMKDLIRMGCDILTIGQYLAPTSGKRHFRIKRFVPPEQFDSYRRLGLNLGFKYVMSGPLIRSSYIAEECYEKCLQGVSKIS